MDVLRGLAFTTKGLEKAPTVDPVPLDATEPLPSARLHSEAAVAVLDKVRYVVQVCTRSVARCRWLSDRVAHAWLCVCV